jgi:hypothetical protein
MGPTTRVVLLLLVLSSQSVAQQIVLSGTVRASDSAALRGVTVQLLNSHLHTVTDSNGRYSLAVPADGVVSFSLTGRRPTQQQVLARTTIDLTMELDRSWSRVLFPGTPVRVATKAGAYNGDFVTLAGERLVVQSATTMDSIPVRLVDAMWKRVPAVEPGARVGLVVGALTAGIITHVETRNARRVCLLKGALCGPEARAMYVVLSGAMGGAGGAIVGAAIGRSFATWARVHP